MRFASSLPRAGPLTLRPSPTLPGPQVRPRPRLQRAPLSGEEPRALPSPSGAPPLPALGAESRSIPRPGGTASTTPAKEEPCVTPPLPTSRPFPAPYSRDRSASICRRGVRGRGPVESSTPCAGGGVRASPRCWGGRRGAGQEPVSAAVRPPPRPARAGRGGAGRGRRRRLPAQRCGSRYGRECPPLPRAARSRRYRRAIAVTGS